MFDLRMDDAIRLRQLCESDADDLFALVEANRDSLAQWLPWVPENTTPKDSLSFIRFARDGARTRGVVTAGIFLKGKLGGVIGHHNLDRENRSVQIGYWLAEPLRGRGIITSACRELTGYSFAAMQLHRVEIQCALENARSRAIPHALGFREEGVRREAEFVAGRFHDLVVYAMLEDEWPLQEKGQA